MKQLCIRTKITLWFSTILIIVVALTYLVILSVSGQIIQKTIRDNLILAVENNVDEIEYFTSVASADIDESLDYYIHYGDGYVQVDDDFLDKVNQIYTSLCQSDGSLVYGVNPIARETATLDFLDSEVQTITVNGTLYSAKIMRKREHGLKGQCYGKGTSAPGLAFSGNAAAVELCNLHYHGETQSAAFTCVGGIRLIKTVEDVRQDFRRDPDAVICYGKYQCMFFRIQTNSGMPLRDAVAVGIADQVGEKAGQQLAVAGAVQAWFCITGQGNIFFADQRHVGADAFHQFA